jgi:hypothetical protein
MLTTRGWWLLMITLFVTATGVAIARERGAMVALIGLTVLAWVVIEWCFFLWALRWGRPGIRIEREVRDDRGIVTALWAGHSFTVILRLTCDSR